MTSTAPSAVEEAPEETSSRDPVVSALQERLEFLERQLQQQAQWIEDLQNLRTVPDQEEGVEETKPLLRDDGNQAPTKDAASPVEDPLERDSEAFGNVDNTKVVGDKEKDKKNEDEEKASELVRLALLPEDTFSLLVYSRKWVTLVFSVMTMSFQLATLSILIADVVDVQQTIQRDPDDYIPNNPVGIPAAVKWEVVVAQLFALVISLLSEDDVKWALNIFISGYEPDLVMRALVVGAERAIAAHRGLSYDESKELVPASPATAEPPRRSFQGLVLRISRRFSWQDNSEQSGFAVPPNLELRWRLSNYARFTVGCMSLAATFMLIVRSETVLDILLNFTAIEFVSQIDNGIFALAKWGYFGERLKEDANHPICDNRKFTILRTLRCGSDWRFIWNTSLRIMLAVFIIGCWFWVLSEQNSGGYLTKEIYIQMGDSSDLNLGTYSGIYIRTDRRRRRASRRFAWVAKLGTGEFTFCIRERAWIFRDPMKAKNNSNPCDWILKSEDSESFDLLSTANDAWVLKEEFNLEVPVDTMLMVAHSSENKARGERCTSPTTYGANCEYTNVCPMLAVDARRPPFVGDRDIPTEFSLLEDIEVYDRPVYVGTHSEEDALYIVMYTGRRWIIATTLFWVDEDQPFLDAEGVAAMLQDFRVRTFSRKLGVLFISETVDAATSENSVIPENLPWFYAQGEQASDIGNLVNIDSGREVTTTLLCAQCNNEDYECFFDAPCVSNQCDCIVGSKGTRCEVPATRNGFCNTKLNVLQFTFDRGDCCMSTCRNSASFSCGKSANGFNDIRNVECNLERASLGWARIGESSLAPLSSAARFGGAVSLTTEGTTLLVGSPDGDGVVSIFRQDGSQWVFDTRDILIDFPNEEFGRRILIAELIPNSIGNEFSTEELSVVGYSLIGGVGFAYFYSCSFGSCVLNSIRGTKIESDEPVPSGEGVVYTFTQGLMDENSTVAEFSFLPFNVIAIDGNDDTFPGALSLDSRYFCSGGRRLIVYERVKNEMTWDELFILDFLDDENGQVGFVQYVDMSGEMVQSDRSDEYVIVIGLQRYSRDVGFTGQSPLEVRVFQWLVGSEPQQLGAKFVSDYHLVTDLATVPDPNGDLAGTTTVILLKDSVHISVDGKILVYSSFFLSDDSGLNFDDINPTKTNASESVLMEYDRALEAVVFVRFWDGNEWTLRHKFVLGQKQDSFLQEGWTTSMSHDANVIAIGILGKVEIYQWNGTAYEQDTVIQTSQERPSLSVSGDGSALAIGSPTSQGRGTVDVYQNDRYSPCSGDSKLMHLSFTTGDATSMTQWRVRGERNQILREGGPYSLGEVDLPNNVTFVYKECFVECSSMSVLSTASSTVDEGTFAAYFNGELLETLEEEVEKECQLDLLWSGLEEQ